MLEESLKTIAATPPPQDNIFTIMRNRFGNAKQARIHLNALEERLGLPLTQPPVTLFAMHGLIKEAEFKLNDLAANAKYTSVASAMRAKLNPVDSPVPPSSTSTVSEVLAEYEGIEHPADRVEFYRANKTVIDREFRNAEPVAHVPKPTGMPVVDRMNAIIDPRKRTEFYRNNKAAVDAAYRNNKS